MIFTPIVKQRKPVRTLSGVTPLAVMVEYRNCPHGTCVYCPNVGVPISYVEKSPVVLRASSVQYDAFEQVKIRLHAFEAMNHPNEKIELIIMGGTFLSYPIDYQYDFVKKCYDGLNGFISKNLEEAKKANETAKHRCVALCIETKPDFCKQKEIDRMLDFGATRCELGVQIPDDVIYKKVNRGHKVQDVIEATRLLKNSGFKIAYHYMPNLPGSNRELIELLIRMKTIVPRYCRIQRIMREFPLESLKAGNKATDLRAIVKREMKKRGLKCRCIRCREVGYAKAKISEEDIQLMMEEYDASGGKEIFLSYEDVKNDILISLLRLRIPSQPFRKEITKKTALLRELHTYGQELDLGISDKEAWQHKGYGKRLVKEAEKIAKEYGMEKMVVISGVGVRNYFNNLSYIKDGPYMSKRL
ncbi:GNAT family N-acetyltransferase [Candidatus Woesearchaeota archaeon]|nr:GNAT family N-acetyltransferase [Candidatus Woesearchaeota archaeon]